jgi:hypothetical protein
MKKLPMSEYNTNGSLDDHSHIDPSKSPERYVIRDASFALAPHPPIKWIIDQLISTGSLSMFFGDPGTKKTFSMLSLAVCVALGKPWLDFETTTRKVLIVDEESGEPRLALRLGKAIRGELGDESTPIKFVSHGGFNLDDKKGEDELQNLIKTTGAGLVIIDALAEIMNGDENSKQDTHPVFAALRRIAEETRAAIIPIHHSNKNGGYRGSSAIMGALDQMIKIESKDGSNWIQFTTEKSRDSVAVNFTAEVTWTENQFHLRRAEVKDKVKPLSQSQSYVIQYLAKNGASPMPDIMGAADSCSENAAKQAVYKLVGMDKVYRTNPDKKGPGVKAIYDLTKEDDIAIPVDIASLDAFIR